MGADVQPHASCAGQPGRPASPSLRFLTCDMHTGTPRERETPRQICRCRVSVRKDRQEGKS